MSLNNKIYTFEEISNNKLFTLKNKLELSIKAANKINELHKKNIFYKNLNSNSFCYDKSLDNVVLSNSLKSNDIDTNKLLYISPEQTGRINRVTDYRTDIYSFGIILYKLFTKKYPFDYNDPIQIIHAHIAKIPSPVSSINSYVPASLSKIIEKLLKKEPEERYQSLSGIAYDLTKVLRNLDENNNDEFILGSKDISHRPNVPQTLYGRNKEKELLNSCFYDMINNNQKQLVTIQGYSGIGKSALIQNIYKLAIKENTYYLSSKFDQYRKTTPYYGLIIALQEYIHHILLSHEYKLEQFKKYLLSNIGSNINLMCEIIPNLELIIPKTISPTILNPKEAQNRFNLTFLNFIKTICNFEDSLVIILDDIQWADSATLNIIQQIIEDKQIDKLMLVLSYRNNETYSKHHLNHILNNLNYERFNFTKICLEPLENNYISKIVQDTLHVDEENSRDLVNLIEIKTRGNPFFIKEFLHNLYDEKLLRFDQDSSSWRWDIKKIDAKNITDNVADLMIQKIDSLSNFSKKILEYFSCLNKSSSINLSQILNIEEKKIHLALVESLELGLIIQIGHDSDFKFGYKFSHDKVKEAVYSKFDSKKRKEFHLKVGNYLLKENDLDKNIFDIVEHLNSSEELVITQKDKFDLASYNYKAALKAKNSNAYDSSIEFLQKSLILLSNNSWTDNYSLTLKVHSLLCECYYLNLDFENAHNYFNLTLKNCVKINDKIKISQIQIYSLIAQNKMSQALKLGLDILEDFGSPLPLEDDINIYYPKLFSLYDENNISSLEELPELKDQNKLDILDILNSIMAPAYLSAPHIYPKICYLAIKLCITYGNCKASANVYAVHSLLLCGFFAKYKNGLDFANLALKIVSKYNATIFESKVEMISNACVFHWNKHIKYSLEGLKRAVISGLNSGDFEYACYSSMYYCLYSILNGKDVQFLIEENTKYLSLMKDLKQEYQIHYTSIWQQFLININDNSKNKTVLEGNVFSEKNSLEILKQSNNISTLYCFYLAKSMLYLYFDDLKEAYKHINMAKQYHMGVISLFHFNEFYIYESIILYKYYKENKDKQINKKEIIHILKENLSYYNNQAKTSKENNKHKVFAIKGMIKHLKNKDKKCWYYFEEALKQTEKNKFIQMSAIYNELLAQFWIENKKNDFASIYINKAYSCYKKWKAFSISTTFHSKYKTFFDSESSNENNSFDFNFKTFDLNSVIKASLAISEEITLENLLNKIMSIIIENSGSQIGALILNNNNDLNIEVCYCMNNETTKELKDIKELPQSIINYVKRTKESVLYNSNETSEQFITDKYIIKNEPKSIFCLPIIYKKTFLGILYLENREINNLYTQDKISLLNVLVNQAAISIDHAKLFKQTLDHSKILESTVKEKTKKLKNAIEDLRVYATIDSMTGLNNRRYFFELGNKLFNKSKRNNKDLCALLFDIDNFKTINDTYGHNIGDEAIKFFAEALKRNSTEDTLAGRLGGDEFVFLFYDKDENFIENTIENIKKDISILNIKESDLVLAITASVGKTHINDNFKSLDNLILEADSQMYKEKTSRKLQIRTRM